MLQGDGIMAEKSGSKSFDKVKLEAIVWLLIALCAYWAAQPFDKPLPFFAPGAAFWPKVVIVILLISGAILFISRFLPQSRREEGDVAYLDEAPDDLPPATWRTILLFVLPVVWTYGMHKMGFLLVTPFFLIAFTWLMGVKKWTTLLSFSLLFYAGLVIVFYKIIFTSLPMGAGYFHTINGELMALIQ